MRVQKQPVYVDAALYDGKLVGDPDPNDPGKVLDRTCPDWFPALTPTINKLADAHKLEEGSTYFFAGSDSLFIVTKEGYHECRPGDLVIRGVKGELYSIKPDIFLATYLSVNTSGHLAFAALGVAQGFANAHERG